MDERPGELRQDGISTFSIAVAAISLGSISTADEVRTKEQPGNVSARLGHFLSIWPSKYDKQL